jgi:hypothetical protein
MRSSSLFTLLAFSLATAQAAWFDNAVGIEVISNEVDFRLQVL